DLARFGIHHDERRTLRLVRAHRDRELALGNVLDAFVDRQDDVVTGERLLVVRALGEDEATASIAEALHFVATTAKLVGERELEAVFSESVGRDEAEHRTCELATRVVATSFAFDGEALQGLRAAFRIAEIANGLRLFGGHAALQPHESLSLRELREHVVRI